jgi:murein DD-endopeptidase MepM/ murein hydrolase activator NlpD
MRTKLASIVVLASLLAILALGGGLAGADPLGGNEVVEPASPPLSTTPTPPPAVPACSDGIDNDHDGLIDMADPDCSSPEDNEEAPEPTEGQGVSPGPQSQPAPFQQGTPLGGGSPGGVVKNEGLGGGGSANGGISAPSANGGGDQPLAGNGGNGGSQFATGGAPTAANPTTTFAPFGPAPVGVPNFVIDSFEIPPFLLPIYQACGTEYGIPWEVLAAINKIETGFGTNLNVSSAGAVGWMQFLPSSWETYGLDANGDGRKDPYNPVDAICAAAHYLRVAGGTKNLYNAILAYNHADWYAQEVLTYARAYGRLPSNLVGSLTGLTEGAHFPIAASARYADDISARAAIKSSTPGARAGYGNAAEVISSSPTRRGINIFSHSGAPVVAVNDGTILKVGQTAKLGRFIVLEDTYGNRYTYAELGKVVINRRDVVAASGKRHHVPVDSQDLRPRLRALPGRAAGKGDQGEAAASPAATAPQQGRLRGGMRVIAGTVLAKVGEAEEGIEPHINFAIRPAGSGAQRIDPKPILDGWKLLEATAIYRAKGKNPFAAELSGAGVLLLSKEALERRILADRGLAIKGCGRKGIANGQIDRRVLAMLEYLRAKGFRMKIAALACGQGYLASASSQSERSTGNAVEISEVDGKPVKGNQGPETPAHEVIRDLLQLQGTMHPHDVISLEDLPGATSFARANQRNAIRVGYSPTLEIAYVNPFLSAAEGRIDMGVDFTGVGPISAVGDAKVLRTGAPGWPEGGGVLYQLLNGPRASQVIYVYEGVAATVKAGERVSAGQQIANFVPGGSIEMGFADAAGAPLAAGVYQEGDVTEWGREMQSFLDEIGGASSISLNFSPLSPQKWSRLINRLGEIPNPTVPSAPSKYSLPDGARGESYAGQAGGTPQGK